MIVKIKKLSKDFLFNILASGVITIVLQLAVYPIFGRYLDAAEYGLLMTIMGIQNTVINACGNALDNTRLIQNSQYDQDENGDFNILLVIGIPVSVVLLLLFFFLIKISSPVIIILLIFSDVLGILRSYYTAAYRIKLAFNKFLICNLLIAAGYLVGIGLFCIGSPWPITFIMGELFGLVYLYKTSFLISKSFQRTKRFKKSASKYLNIGISTAIASALTYLDRLLILPILGAELVGVYSVASIVGKTLGMVMLPISGVLLGYYSQKGFLMTRKTYFLSTGVFSSMCGLFYLLTIAVGKWVVRILYPAFLEEASNYMTLANAAAIILILGNMISPTVIRFAKSYWQIIISMFYVLIYCFLGVFLSKKNGLTGFCYAALVANSARFILLFCIGLLFIDRKRPCIN